MKLVKDKKVVRIERVRSDVVSTLKRAERCAVKERWNRVIIIGEGNNIGRSLYSKIPDDTIIFMLEKLIHRILSEYN